MNTKALKSLMALNGDTGNSLAQYLGISTSSFSAKINGKTAEFTQGEISKIKQKYNLSADQIDVIFFDC